MTATAFYTNLIRLKSSRLFVRVCAYFTSGKLRRHPHLSVHVLKDKTRKHLI